MALTLNHRLTGSHPEDTILLLHGFLGDLDDWDEIASQLGSEWRCLSVDLPGHGATPSSEDLDDYRMPRVTAALISLLDALGIQRCSVLGYSMGGRAALHLALTVPQRVGALILESASPGMPSPDERLERRASDEAIARRLESDDFEDFLRAWYAQPMFATLARDPQRLNALIRKRLRNRPRELAKCLRGMGVGSQPSLWASWPSNRVPTRIIVGEEDAKYHTIASEMARQCAAAEVCVMSGCGHNVHYENPGAYANAVTRFLRAH